MILNFKAIFEKIAQKEGHTFQIDEMYSQETPLEIKDENGNFQKVSGMIIKENEILKITTKSGKIVEVASLHVIKMADETQKYTQELVIGDILANVNGPETIVSIEKLPVEKVYDLAIDSETHLYSDADGFIHHNTFHITKVLQDMKGSPKGPDAEWRHFKGMKSSPFGLFRILFENAHDKVIVFDDSKLKSA